MDISNIELFVNPSGKDVVINKLYTEDYLVFSHDMFDFTISFINCFRNNYPEAYNAAYEIHGKGSLGKFLTAQRLIRCNFYLNDNIADFDDDGNVMVENVPCPLKNGKFCPFQNVICNPKLNTTISDRELEVAKLFASGYSPAEISNSLYISEHTVKNHRKNIYQKLNIHDIGSLTAYAYKTGWMK